MAYHSYEQIKCILYSFLHRKDNDPKWEERVKTNNKRIFIFLAGLYQNLGDMAITYSQKEFLKNLFPDAEIIVIPSTQTYQSARVIKKIIRPDDLVTILGGGNMDDVYPSLENARLYIVKSFPNNKIISFPQTIAFSNTKKGIRSLKKSIKVYKSHKKLTIFVREHNSLRRAKNDFLGVRVGFCPDIVLSINKGKPITERKNVLCCLRNDAELGLSTIQSENIRALIKSKYNNAIEKDTVDIPLEACTLNTYQESLESFWNLVRSCKVVVTDRLHCLIFCVITGTPVVAIDNSNKKISGIVNAWLYNIPWISMVEQYDEAKILDAVESLYHYSSDITIPDLSEQFKTLIDACKY